MRNIVFEPVSNTSRSELNVAEPDSPWREPSDLTPPRPMPTLSQRSRPGG